MRYSNLFSIAFLVGSVLASDFAFDVLPRAPLDLSLRQNSGCGSTNGKCNENGCNGFNDPNGGTGRCLSGQYEDCPCESVCGPPGACNANGCKGMNDFESEFGICTAGDFKGCKCTSVCHGTMNPCNENECGGTNSPGGQSGLCTQGEYLGCFCASICGAQNGPCSAENCKGNGDGICTESGLRGCPCTKENEPACGNTELGLCTENGCNGLFNEHDGFGICQDQFKGCPCKRE